MMIDACWASDLATRLLEEDQHEACITDLHTTVCAWTTDASADEFITATEIFLPTMIRAAESIGNTPSYIFLLHAVNLWSVRLAEVSDFDNISYDSVTGPLTDTNNDTGQSMQVEQGVSPLKAELMFLTQQMNRWLESHDHA